MYLKHRIVVKKSIHDSTQVAITARTNEELQIQVETSMDDIFFNLDIENVVNLRDALNEFLGVAPAEN